MGRVQPIGEQLQGIEVHSHFVTAGANMLDAWTQRGMVRGITDGKEITSERALTTVQEPAIIIAVALTQVEVLRDDKLLMMI